MSSSQHLAVIIPSKGAGVSVDYRPTPTPGPNDVLIEVKSIALNPIDHYQRDVGIFLDHYPAVVGSDVAGVVLSVGSAVPADAPKPGDRVAGFATTFIVRGAPDYGAFQKRVLIPAVNVVPLPHGMTFNDGAVLPMAVLTAFSGFYSIGMPLTTVHSPSDKQGLLVWGAASSIGTAVVQIARTMGFWVYATASEKHHEYIKGLGASRVFDYKNKDLEVSMVNAAKEDGVTIKTAYFVIGDFKACLDILKALSPDGTAKVCSAVPLREGTPKVEGIEAKFVAGPMEVKERDDHFRFIFNVWLKKKLETGEFVASPKIKVVEGGLHSVSKALDELKGGVSGTKLVLEV